MYKELRCSVFKGMFSDELAIKYSSRGRSYSTFVPKDKVDKENQRVKVRVHREGEAIWAVLPSADHATILVQESDLQ